MNELDLQSTLHVLVHVIMRSAASVDILTDTQFVYVAVVMAQNILLLTEKLFPHLAEIDAACKNRLDIIETAMMRQEGVTEALKAADQMEWVRRRNSIHSRAEEIVLHELVYAE